MTNQISRNIFARIVFQLFQIPSEPLVEDASVHNIEKRTFLWKVLATLCFFLSLVTCTINNYHNNIPVVEYLYEYFKEYFYIVCIGCNVLLWPVAYVHMNQWFCQSIQNTLGDKNKKAEEKVYSQYYKILSFEGKKSTSLFCAMLISLILFAVFYTFSDNIFGSFFLNAIAILAFSFISFVASYSLIILVAINVGLKAAIKEGNEYKTPDHPKYSKFISELLSVNSKITILITIIYVILWVGVVNGPIREWESSLSLYAIMFVIGLFPMTYAIYNITLKKQIIEQIQREDIVKLDERLEAIYIEISTDNNLDMIEEYYKLEKFRDHLISSKKGKIFALQIELVFSTIGVILPPVIEFLISKVLGW